MNPSELEVEFKGYTLVLEKQCILNAVDIQIRKGKITSIAGLSGSGKTTLLKCIMGISGGKEFGVKNIFTKQKKMQIVFQDPGQYLQPLWSMRQILHEPLILYGIQDENLREKKILDSLEHYRLNPQELEKNITLFSGGELQRIAIIRALLCEPELLLLDEPVSALDSAAKETVLKMLSSLNRENGISVVLVSHDMDAVKKISDVIYFMEKGKVVEEGDLKILTEPKSRLAKEMLDSIDLSGIRH